MAGVGDTFFRVLVEASGKALSLREIHICESGFPEAGSREVGTLEVSFRKDGSLEFRGR